MISIVNYGMGNIHSVINALAYLGEDSRIVSTWSEVLASEKIVLPGVGSFRLAMRNLSQMGLVGPLTEFAIEKRRPVLGICLGMQLMADRGTEDGETTGLGWIPGSVLPLEFEDPRWRVPHIGFNTVTLRSPRSRLFESLPDDTDFYFVHGYHLVCASDSFVSGRTDYNGQLVASVERDNIFGTQFHPEKSQSNGLMLLRNFARIEI